MQPIRGTCRCGGVEMEISAPPLITVACHCTGCQKMTASAFSLGVLIPDNGFRVLRGEPVIGGMHGAIDHRFCPYCMSWVFSRMPGTNFVNVRPSLLDGPAWTEPFVETWTDEKLPWVSTPARHRFAKFPPQEAWPTMIAEFAATAAGR